jgi:hypothetical protein
VWSRLMALQDRSPVSGRATRPAPLPRLPLVHRRQPTTHPHTVVGHVVLPDSVLAIGSRSDPEFTLVVIGIAAMLAVFLWGMYKVERQLNDEGQSLFYPWRAPKRKQKGLRVDNALRNALQGLADCDSTVMIAWRLELRTKDGKLVPEAARGSYDKAVARLENATGLERSEERRVLREAEKWLWAARAEWLRG